MKAIHVIALLFIGFLGASAVGMQDPLLAATITSGSIYATSYIVKIAKIKLPNGIMGTYLSPEQLEREAKNLSNYNGRASYMYTGEGDDMLSFEGDIKSFAAELDKNVDKQFTVSLTNANAATRIPVLFAGYLKGNATLMPGQLVQGAFNDANGNAGLTGNTEEQKAIEELVQFMNWCPTRLLAMKVQNTTVPDQLLQNLTYQRLNPFKVEETKIIRPKNWVNQDTFQNDQVTFPVDVQIDVLSSLKYAIAGSSTTFITFYFGASLNVSGALEKKAARAHANIKVVGANRVIEAANRKAIGG